VRPRDELDRRLAGDRVDRHPHAAGLRALDVVVRLVLVPRRPLARAGFLDEQVVVEETDAARAHQAPRDLGRSRAADEQLVLRNALPVAEVLDEPAGVVRAARDERALARFAEVPLDPAPDELDFLRRERVAHAHGPVASERVDQLGSHLRHAAIV
jgi:hypothetical protein